MTDDYVTRQEIAGLYTRVDELEERVDELEEMLDVLTDDVAGKVERIERNTSTYIELMDRVYPEEMEEAREELGLDE